jgi:hypothetical protein
MENDTKKPPIYLAETVPRQSHTVICKTCREPFKTSYSYQIYCNNPCRFEYDRKPKKPKVVRQTNKQAAQKRKDKAEIERQNTLKNRALFSTRL